MTVCNMSIEAGARAGLVAPDDKTFAYMMGRPHAPKGAAWEQALAYWKTLPTDPGATYDKEAHLSAADIAPHVTWGTDPNRPRPSPAASPRPRADRGSAASCRGRALAAIHAACTQHASPMCRCNACLSACAPTAGSRTAAPPRRPAPGSRGRRRRRRAGGTRVPATSSIRPRKRGRPRLPRSRVRMARCRLLDVHVEEQRQGDERRARADHLEPYSPEGRQGQERQVAPDGPGNGCCRRHHRPPQRCAAIGLITRFVMTGLDPAIYIPGRFRG